MARKVALIEHARGLAQTIPSLPGIDALLHTAERDPVDVADEIKALLVRSGVIPRP